MDPSLGPGSLDSGLPPLDSPTDLSPTAIVTPTKASTRKRKHSSYSELHGDDVKPALSAFDDDNEGSARKSRPAGTKRACNQCRQQKLKCNVVESPWKDCDRCKKHGLRCEITADFKRIGKRSQQAELERNNDILARRVEELERQLAAYREQDSSDLDGYRSYGRRPLLSDLSTAGLGLSGAVHDDDSHDAALLLNLKQSHDLTGSGARASPAGHQRKLGDVFILPDVLAQLWDEYFQNYNIFLSILDGDKDSPDSIFEKSEFLFWTILVIAVRHYPDDSRLLSRLVSPYMELVKDTTSKPPSDYYVVKALCLLCTWPVPVSTTTQDMTFALAGTMMKFAMQLGLHRPSHPMDFSRDRIQLREADISDRLQTWAACNIVSQNISTGYGQPPDTVYDSTLNTALNSSNEQYPVKPQLRTRLEIEKLADKITRNIYTSQQQHNAGYDEGGSVNIRAAILGQDLQRLLASPDLISTLDRLYAHAVQLHLRLYIFFEEPSSSGYQLSLNELYGAVQTFLAHAFNSDIHLKYAPNYVLQMMLASSCALLKLLNSFFASYVDREAGEALFWDTITAIRNMSVRSNDLPQRLAEVFAQMWKADAERMHEAFAVDEGGADAVSAKAKNGEVDASLALKRRYRMSQSHVYDAIWRWKDEMQGKVRAEKLEAAVKNPTSPQATTHRGSFSNGRRPSSLLDDAGPGLPGMTSFGGFGGLTLGGTTDLYANSYDIFDPVGWYLDGFGNGTGIEWP